MSWPQIGEYTDNGHVVRVFKAAWAEQVLPTFKDMFAASSETQRRNRARAQGGGYRETSKAELRF